MKKKPGTELHIEQSQTQEILRNQKLTKILEMNVNEPTGTESPTPDIFSPRPYGLLRSYVDHRMSNAVTESNSYSKPTMHICIASLGDALILSALNVDGSSRQVQIEKTDGRKTAFIYLISCIIPTLPHSVWTLQCS